MRQSYLVTLVVIVTTTNLSNGVYLTLIRKKTDFLAKWVVCNFHKKIESLGDVFGLLVCLNFLMQVD